MQPQDESGLTRSGKGKMRRIVVSLLKGGVAKSETAVSVAHGMALQGLRVLLVDTDVQAQCNDMLGVNPRLGLADVITGWCSPASALTEARENLYLLAGGNDLAAVKMEIARREMAPEAVLNEALSNFEDDFDVMIMDTAPGWDTLLVNALFASREVLSPVSMEPVALTGLIRFEERLQIIQKYNPTLTLRWVVPTFVDGRVRKTGEIMEQLMLRYGERVAPSIKYSVKLSEAPAFGKTIYEHDPKGMAAQCYRELTQRVMDDAWTEVEQIKQRLVGAKAVTLASPPPPAPPQPQSEPSPTPPAIRLVTPAGPAQETAGGTQETGPSAVEQPAPAPAPGLGLRARLAVPSQAPPASAPTPAPRPAEPSPPPRPVAVALSGTSVCGLRARLQQAQGDDKSDQPSDGPEPGPDPESPAVVNAAPGPAGVTYRLMDQAIKEIRQRMGKHAGA